MLKNKKSPGRRVWLALLLVLLVLLFIFGNSLRNGEESNADSGFVLRLVRFVIDPMGRLSEESLHYFVRKAAHFTEFAMLGAALWFLTDSLRRRYGTNGLCAAYFASLSAAVTDEFIQSFTGRTSSVRDVLLDFSGAVFALLLSALLWRLLRKRTRKKNRKS